MGNFGGRRTRADVKEGEVGVDGGVVRRDAGGRELKVSGLDGGIVGEPERGLNWGALRGKYRFRYYVSQVRVRWVVSTLFAKLFYVALLGLSAFFVTDVLGGDWQLSLILGVSVPTVVVLVLQAPEFLKTFVAFGLVSPTFWLVPTLVNAFYITYQSETVFNSLQVDEFYTIFALYFSGFVFAVLASLLWSERKLWLSVVLFGYGSLFFGGVLSFLFPQFSIYNVFFVLFVILLYRCDVFLIIWGKLVIWGLLRGVGKFLRINVSSSGVPLGFSGGGGFSFANTDIFRRGQGLPAWLLFSRDCVASEIPYIVRGTSGLGGFNSVRVKSGKGFSVGEGKVFSVLSDSCGLVLTENSPNNVSGEESGEKSGEGCWDSGEGSKDGCGRLSLDDFDINVGGLVVKDVRVPFGGLLDYVVVNSKGVSLIVLVNDDGPVVENEISGVGFQGGRSTVSDVQHLMESRTKLSKFLHLSVGNFRLFIVLTGNQIRGSFKKETLVYKQGDASPVGVVQLVTPDTFKEEFGKGRPVLTTEKTVLTMKKLTSQWGKIRYSPIPVLVRFHVGTKISPHENRPHPERSLGADSSAHIPVSRSAFNTEQVETGKLNENTNEDVGEGEHMSPTELLRMKGNTSKGGKVGTVNTKNRKGKVVGGGKTEGSFSFENITHSPVAQLTTGQCVNYLTSCGVLKNFHYENIDVGNKKGKNVNNKGINVNFTLCETRKEKFAFVKNFTRYSSDKFEEFLTFTKIKQIDTFKNEKKQKAEHEETEDENEDKDVDVYINNSPTQISAKEENLNVPFSLPLIFYNVKTPKNFKNSKNSKVRTDRNKNNYLSLVLLKNNKNK